MISEGTSIPHLLNLENTAQAVISGDWIPLLTARASDRVREDHLCGAFSAY